MKDGCLFYRTASKPVTPYRSKGFTSLESELCDQLGISKEEYFAYLEEEATQAEREGREHIPDVRAEITTTLAIIQLVVGVALTAVSLLSQKPRQKRPEAVNVQKEDNIGRQRHTVN